MTHTYTGNYYIWTLITNFTIIAIRLVIIIELYIRCIWTYVSNCTKIIHLLITALIGWDWFALTPVSFSLNWLFYSLQTDRSDFWAFLHKEVYRNREIYIYPTSYCIITIFSGFFMYALLFCITVPLYTYIPIGVFDW